MPRARWVKPADIDHIAANMRDMDRRECAEIFNCDPLDGVRESVRRSPWCVSVISRGELICIVGVAPDGDMLLNRRGMPWLVGIEGIERHPRAFSMLTGPVIERMEREYPLLSNIVLQENTLSIAWLMRAGFTLGAPEMIGAAKCLRFWKARDAWSDCGDRRDSARRVRPS